MAMKSTYSFLLVLVFGALITMGGDCNKGSAEPQIPIYSYTTPVENPVDHFQFVFNLSTPGDKFGTITFEEDAVWLIEKLGASQINFYMSNGVENYPLVSADTVGLRGGFQYVFIANNNNYEVNNFFSEFRKLELDYASFEPKF